MDWVLKARAALKKNGAGSQIRLEDVVKALINLTAGTPLEDDARARATSPRGPFDVRLYRNGGRVEIRAGDDWVEVEADTESVGPGYHAYLVSALDSLEGSLDLHWEWLDPTGYARTRDFQDLQTGMARRFRNLCAGVVQEIRYSEREAFGVMILMPDDFSVVPTEGEIFTPFGPVSADQLERWASLDGPELLRAAEDFSMWWNRGFGGSFYRGLALYAAWMELRWATPLDPEEGDLIIYALNCYAKALERDVDVPIPQSDFDDLWAIFEGKLRRPVARPEGIGYRRRNWTRRIGDHWQVVMPGALVEIEEEETEEGRAATWAYTTVDLDVRASVYLAPSDDPEILAGVYDGEIMSSEDHIEKFDQTITVHCIAKTHRLGERTSVCFMTITGSPETRAIGEAIGRSLVYVP